MLTVRHHSNGDTFSNLSFIGCGFTFVTASTISPATSNALFFVAPFIRMKTLDAEGNSKFREEIFFVRGAKQELLHKIYVEMSRGVSYILVRINGVDEANSSFGIVPDGAEKDRKTKAKKKRKTKKMSEIEEKRQRKKTREVEK